MQGLTLTVSSPKDIFIAISLKQCKLIAQHGPQCIGLSPR